MREFLFRNWLGELALSLSKEKVVFFHILSSPLTIFSYLQISLALGGFSKGDIGPFGMAQGLLFSRI